MALIKMRLITFFKLSDLWRNLFLPYSIVCLFLFASLRLSGSDKVQVKTISLSCTNPSEKIISIKNTGPETCRFNFKLNDQFYYSLNDILKKIKSNQNNKQRLSEHQRAWSFLKDVKYSFDPFSKKNWTSAITILVNSLGFGQSETVATCLYNLWLNLGFSARLSKLGDYVVSEIYYKERWELYDAAAGIYFNFKNEVIGLNEIKEDKNHSTEIKFSGSPVSICCNRYQDLVSMIYKKNNKQILFQIPKIFEITDSLPFFIPPGGKIEFGAVFDQNLFSERGRSIPYFSNLKLTIPKGWGGFINNPLVIQSITGKGTIKTPAREYDIDSKEFQHELTCGDEFIKYLNLISSDSDIEIIYLINPVITKIKPDNSLKLEGLHIDKLDIKINEIPDSLTVSHHLKKQTLFYHPDRMKIFSDYRNDTSVTIISSEDFLKKIETYFKQKNDSVKGDIIKKKLASILKKYPENIEDADIYKCMTSIPFEMFLYDIEHTSLSEFYDKIKYLGREK